MNTNKGQIQCICSCLKSVSCPPWETKFITSNKHISILRTWKNPSLFFDIMKYLSVSVKTESWED